MSSNYATITVLDHLGKVVIPLTDENIRKFYQALGFEETEQEDGSAELFFVFSEAGNYALITDEAGNMPENLQQTIIFACYTPDNAFLWSTGFKNSLQFQEVWSSGQTLTEKHDAVLKHRDSSGYYNPSV
ncbi:MAG: hypothetical protein ABFC57_11895 [Veillonellales bacterium]